MNDRQPPWRMDRDTLSRLATWLVLAAVLLRALIPAGFMPNFAALVQGGSLIVICSAGVEKTIAVDAEGNALPHQGDRSSAAPCLFAALTPVLMPLLALVLLAILPIPRATGWPIPAGAVWRAFRPPGPLSARGPPLSL